MTNETTRNNLQRMRLSDARELIDWFAEEFGQNHLYFAQHAAFPLSLTPDLLYRLWINFQRNSSGEKLDIPWIAVADLLLSPLCKEVGHELYEMDMTVRTELLTALRNDHNLGMPRIQELSNFLLDYVRQYLSSEDSRTYKFAQAQHWTALAYIRPDQAVHELAQALHALSEDKAERLRIASLIETFADPLADLEGFAPLLVYARNIEHTETDYLPSHNIKKRSMTIPPSLNNLAHLLKQQKGQTDMAHNLLLASTVSLTPTVIKGIYPSRDWANFSSYLHKREAKHGDLTHLLTKHIGIHNNVEGYRALAHMIKEGYFSTILTTNLDSTLEDLLLEAGLAPTAFQTLIVGYDTDEAIVRALDDPSNNIRIVKLHGSLREGVIAKQFPDVSKPPLAFRASLERALNQDIIVVGSMNHDEDIRHMMAARQRSRLYYALPHRSSYDHIIKLIEARGGNLHTSLISGSYGEFTIFFQTLEKILFPRRSSQLIPPVSIQTKHTSTDDEPLGADILLVTATEVGARAVIDCCPENKLCFIGKRVYYDLGTIGGARTFMTQSEMGSDGLGGSRFTVDEGINALSPAAVIMVGIAFGLNEEEHHLGDILVSRQLLAYDNQRIGRSSDGKLMFRMRGDRVSAPTWLLDRFKAGRNTWLTPPDVHFGLLFSGSKLIANYDFQDQLHQIESEAIGGEMEGVGLYEATQRHNVGWLLVKAICDWADGNKSKDKEKHQKEAAENAARFTLHVIQQGGFHNYKDTPKFKTVDDRI